MNIYELESQCLETILKLIFYYVIICIFNILLH